VANQVRGLNAVKNDLLKSYKNRVWDLIEDFKAFNIMSIPRKENEAADRLVAVGVMFDVVKSIKRDKGQPHIHVVVMPVVPNNNTCR
ncbi:hypothetical protein KI387_024654, partial [Taxus chinensis]